MLYLCFDTKISLSDTGIIQPSNAAKTQLASQQEHFHGEVVSGDRNRQLVAPPPPP